MGVLTWPLIGIIIIICYLAIVATRQGVREANRGGNRNPNRQDIPEKVANFPFPLNPMVLIYLVASVFAGVIIFYYWASR